uniref:Uncharacterized protein n=1 Tax=Aegilops tauschii TaxID=37682 RepID=M8B5P5_AEGTA
MYQQADQTRLLPEDMLACVLGRLAPRSLATSRCVCKAWRDTIDARCILRADLLPLSLAGIFINFNELRYSEFFSRPPRPEGLVGNRESRHVQCAMKDHCNGLVLHYNRVANPATGWTAPLPPPPPPKGAGMECFVDEAYLVYDPTVSAHYQVVLIPCVPYIELDIEPGEEIDFDVDPAGLESEWPPSSCVQRVFSSSAKRWEERTFSREGETAGTVAYLGTDCSWNKRHAVYWHDALYVHCQKGFVMRLSLSNSTYQMIKRPGDLEPESCTDLNLGKSKKGVYFALVRASHQIQVWVLTESCGHIKWVLEHDTRLKTTPKKEEEEKAGDKSYSSDSGHMQLDPYCVFDRYFCDEDDKDERHVSFLMLHEFEDFFRTKARGEPGFELTKPSTGQELQTHNRPHRPNDTMEHSRKLTAQRSAQARKKDKTEPIACTSQRPQQNWYQG